MIRENVLEYFEDFREETFRWLKYNYPFDERELRDYNLFFRTKNLGKLHLSTGKIIASDPFVFFDEKPFNTQITPESYSVVLSLARINYEEERVAFAMLKFNEKIPVRWELALRENDDVSKLSEGKFFGYNVDAGTGCFMDVTSQEILNKRLGNKEFHDFLVSEMYKNRNRPWINHNLENCPNNNLIAFSSGWGDGSYASYFGFDENNQVACLITDFEIVKDSEG